MKKSTIPEYNLSFFKGLFPQCTNPSQKCIRKALKSLHSAIFDRSSQQLSMIRVVIHYEDGSIVHLYENSQDFVECMKKPDLQDLQK